MQVGWTGQAGRVIDEAVVGVPEGFGGSAAAIGVREGGTGVVEGGDVVAGDLFKQPISTSDGDRLAAVDTDGQAVGPAVDSNAKRNVSGKLVVADGGWSAQEGIIVEGPGICTDSDTDVEELLSRDRVVRDKDIRITTVVQEVDHVDSTEPRIGRRGGDRVVPHRGTRGAEEDDSSISTTLNLILNEVMIP